MWTSAAAWPGLPPGLWRLRHLLASPCPDPALLVPPEVVADGKTVPQALQVRRQLGVLRRAAGPRKPDIGLLLGKQQDLIPRLVGVGTEFPGLPQTLQKDPVHGQRPLLVDGEHGLGVAILLGRKLAKLTEIELHVYLFPFSFFLRSVYS